jgi:hypothetical protein
MKIMSKQWYRNGEGEYLWRYRVNGRIVLDTERGSIFSIQELEKVVAKNRLKKIS